MGNDGKRNMQEEKASTSAANFALVGSRLRVSWELKLATFSLFSKWG